MNYNPLALGLPRQEKPRRENKKERKKKILCLIGFCWYQIIQQRDDEFEVDWEVAREEQGNGMAV